MPGQLCRLFFSSLCFVHKKTEGQGTFRKQVTVPSMWGYVFETTIFSVYVGNNLAEYILEVLVFVNI